MAIPSFTKTFLKIEKKLVARCFKMSFWFSLGAFVGFFFFISFLYITYRQLHATTIYEGVMINGIDFGGKKKEDVRNFFAAKNKQIQNTRFILKSDTAIATISARQIYFGYDEELLAQQAFSVGRSSDLLSNMSLMLQAYIGGIQLYPAYRYKETRLYELFKPLQEKLDQKPADALFTFENGRVVTFQLSHDGQAVDSKNLKQQIIQQAQAVALSGTSQTITIAIPIVKLQPNITSEKVNNMGIKELIGEGTSLFQHSIENRMFNIGLASSRLHGALIPPGEVFSVTKTIGDVSAFTGYKQAYVIENGKTILGDGGGVCQVSTTLFRAALNAGLPIVERHPHAYRVGYYEQDSPPGIDASIYSPNIDLKFKNDTGHYILLQSYFDQNAQRLTFDLYGTRDNREVFMDTPVILSQSAAPAPLYQDDPTLPKGVVKQVDFSAAGANVYFTRTVKKDGKVYLADKFVSNYRPWQAIFLQGTKE